MKSTLKESKISQNNIDESILPQTLPRIIKKPEVILELNDLPKTKTHPSTYQEKFHSVLQHHPNHLYVFMNGSKDNDKTACAVILNKTIIKKSLPMESSMLHSRSLCNIFSSQQYLEEQTQEIYHIL